MCAVYIHWDEECSSTFTFIDGGKFLFFKKLFIQLMRNTTTTNDVIIIIVTKASYYNGLVLQSSLTPWFSYYYYFKKKYLIIRCRRTMMKFTAFEIERLFFHAGVRPWPFPSFPLKLHHERISFLVLSGFFLPISRLYIIASPEFHHPFWLFAVRSW